jgi:hypothetical protein
LRARLTKKGKKGDIMGVDEMRQIRDKAVKSMQEQLTYVEPTGLPQWVLMSLMLPVFFGEALKMTVKIVGVCLKGMIMLPFKGMAVWADMMGIIYWFLRQIVERMGRK